MPGTQVLTPIAADFSGLKNWACSLDVNAALGASFTIKLAGNFQTIPENIRWNYVLVDNIDSATDVIVSFNSYALKVPAYSRQTLPIPNTCENIALTAVLNNLKVILSSEMQLAPDIDNQLAIALATKVKFPITVVVATGNQDANASGEKMVFESPTATITYNLLNPAVVTNGYNQFIQNDSVPAYNLATPFYVEIKPPVGITINNVFTNAAPMRLYPGDSGLLITDGAEWYFQGSLSYTSLPFACPALGGSQVINNPCGRAFDVLKMSLRVVTANNNYNVGDEIELGYANTTGQAAATNATLAWIIDNANDGTTITIRRLSTAQFRLLNKTTGVVFDMVAANFNMVVRGTTRW